MNNLLQKYSSGQSMVEVLIATTVIAVVLTAIVSTMTLSIRSTAESRARAQATKLAQEAMELYRRERAILGWEQFRSAVLRGGSSQIYCLDTIPTSSSQFRALNTGSCTQDAVVAGTPFTRETVLSEESATAIRVRIEVRWEDGRRTNSADLEQVLRRRE